MFLGVYPQNHCVDIASQPLAKYQSTIYLLLPSGLLGEGMFIDPLPKIENIKTFE